jgi:nitrogenase molybdenum-iron protein alpha/beta subunit
MNQDNTQDIYKEIDELFGGLSPEIQQEVIAFVWSLVDRNSNRLHEKEVAQ